MRFAMKALIRAVAVSLCLILFLSVAFADSAKKTHEWWKDSYLSEPNKSPNAKKLPRIAVRGNHFVDPAGKVVLFRGLNISDPDKISNQGHWSKEHFAEVKAMGANLVRIPVHPIAWRERGPKAYLALLDEAVEWCAEEGMYVVIDWHSIGNLKAGLFQDPMYETSMPETSMFWRTISHHFAGNNTVAFYELFNEPTLYSNQLGRVTWDEWKKINEDLIATIRANDMETIPLVAGFDWAYDLSPLRINPVEAANIGYVTHPYPHKRSKPWEPKWEENFGFAANDFPIVATEIGFTLGKEGMADNGEYGAAIVKYLEGRGISWVAWVFDPEWTPTMFSSWDSYKLTDSGEFFKQAMQANNVK
jgi:aryl-phospho-beta-D-glucosidase BglC (GH1 family)